jgi:hypothetical protein
MLAEGALNSGAPEELICAAIVLSLHRAAPHQADWACRKVDGGGSGAKNLPRAVVPVGGKPEQRA